MRIYLVEDDELVCRTICDFLTDLGHVVVMASTCDIQVVAERKMVGPLDMVLLGVSPSAWAADRLIKRVHAMIPAVPVVVMTTGGALQAAEAVECGVHAYLRKPLRLAELELALLRIESGLEPRVSSTDCPELWSPQGPHCDGMQIAARPVG